MKIFDEIDEKSHTESHTAVGQQMAVNHKYLNNWSRRSDLNRGPADYELYSHPSRVFSLAAIACSCLTNHPLTPWSFIRCSPLFAPVYCTISAQQG